MRASKRPSQPKGTAALASIAILAMLSQSAASQESLEQMRLRTLTEEGELLVREHKELQPMLATLEQEKEQLASEESVLMAETEALRRDIDKHNALIDEINADVRRQEARCQPAGDSARVQVCNARATELRGRAAAVAKQAPGLNRRQKALNERIVRYNAAGAEWNKRSQDTSARLGPHQRNVDGWVGKVTELLRSNSLAPLLKKADSPACEAEPLAQSAALAPDAAIERALECLRTLRASSR